MIVTIQGTLMGVKSNYPERDRGQDFTPNQMLNVAQVKPDGDVELIKIKDENMSRKHEVGKASTFTCDVRLWQMNSRSGLTIKLIEPVKS
jgi:hypothetical protein